MSIYYGDDAIIYLGKKHKKKDLKSSTHWDMYHLNFSFDGEILSGIEGFGSNEKPYIGLRKIAHHLLQIPFRKMGEKYPNFDVIDKVAKSAEVDYAHALWGYGGCDDENAIKLKKITQLIDIIL